MQILINNFDQLINSSMACDASQESESAKPHGDEEILISNFEYEKRMRKMFRNKSLSRSLRRAKSVYYRNRRSKSLEDLSVEDRNNYLRDKAANSGNMSSSNMRKSRLLLGRNGGGSTLSIASSCSSVASKMSDISSSYFHDLSDWSPEFSSSECESSEEELFHNVDWDANLSNIVFVSPEKIIVLLSHDVTISRIKYDILKNSRYSEKSP